MPWVAYIDFSMFRLIPNDIGPRPGDAAGDNDGFIPYDGDLNKLDGPPTHPKLRHHFRQAMLLEGVDIPGLGGWLTAAHGDTEIEKTVAAVEKAVIRMTAEGLA